MAGRRMGGVYGPGDVTPLHGASRPRIYVLASGDAIATYCPANGSEVPVSAGDRLYYGNTRLWLTATLCTATMRWLGDRMAESVQTTITGSASYQIGWVIPVGATGLWFDTWEGDVYVATTNDVTNKWQLTIAAEATVLDTYDTWLTVNQTPSRTYKFRRALAAYVAAVATGTDMGAGVSFNYLNRVKVAAGGNLFGNVSVTYRPVYA